MKQYFNGIFYNLSRLGNAIAGGNPNVSISGRIGSKHRSTRYWRFANDVVDFAFFPIEGGGHCFRAWKKHEDEMFIDTGNPFAFIILTYFFWTVCLPLSLLTWTGGLLVWFVKWLFRLA